MKGDAFMRILTNVSKAELAYLTNQPTAKAMIEKVKTEGIYIAEGSTTAISGSLSGSSDLEPSRK